MSERRATYFIDVDGTILPKISRSASTQWSSHSKELLPGVRDWFDAVEKTGACIILTTARRESNRSHLEALLRDHGLFWDHLIMNCGNGERVVINDGLCRAEILATNTGLEWVVNS